MAPVRTSSLVSRSGTVKTRSSRPREYSGAPNMIYLLLALVVLVPGGSYLLLHKNMLGNLTTLNAHLQQETEEVERLRKQVAEMDEIKSALTQAVDTLHELEKRGVAAAVPKVAPTPPPPTRRKDMFDLAAIRGTTPTAPSKCPRGSAFEVGPSEILQSRSGQPKLFKDKYEGKFIDVGAGDGIFMSKSYFFEKVMCWDGIVIEPSPAEYPKLAVNRKFSHAIQAVVDDAFETMDFSDVTLQGKWSGWSGIEKSWTPQHVAQVQRAVERDGFVKNTIPVKALSLTKAIEAASSKLGVTTGVGGGHLAFDLMIVAVEGHELNVIQSLDFDRYAVSVIQVEVEESQPQRVVDMKEFLKGKGYREPYRLWPNHKDLIFVHTSYTEI